MVLPGQIMAWPEDWRELWNERAAIMQYDGLQSQKQAEYAAETDIRRLAMGCSSTEFRALAGGREDRHSTVNGDQAGSLPAPPAK